MSRHSSPAACTCSTMPNPRLALLLFLLVFNFVCLPYATVAALDELSNMICEPHRIRIPKNIPGNTKDNGNWSNNRNVSSIIVPTTDTTIPCVFYNGHNSSKKKARSFLQANNNYPIPLVQISGKFLSPFAAYLQLSLYML